MGKAKSSLKLRPFPFQRLGPYRVKSLRHSLASVALLLPLQLMLACSGVVAETDQTTNKENSLEIEPTVIPSPPDMQTIMEDHPLAPATWTPVVINPVDSSRGKTHVLLLQASDSNHPGLPPILALRCKDRELAVVLNFHEPLAAKSRTIEYEFDADGEEKALWGLTKRNDAAILKPAQDFVSKLLESDKFRADIVASDGSLYFANFNVGGLREQLALFPDVCQI